MSDDELGEEIIMAATRSAMAAQGRHGAPAPGPRHHGAAHQGPHLLHHPVPRQAAAEESSSPPGGHGGCASSHASAEETNLQLRMCFNSIWSAGDEPAEEQLMYSSYCCWSQHRTSTPSPRAGDVNTEGRS